MGFFGWLADVNFRSQMRKAGPIVEEVICPYCQERGMVHVREVRKDEGLSGDKMVAGAVTLGVSVLFTGLSVHRKRNQMTCENCGMEWIV